MSKQITCPHCGHSFQNETAKPVMEMSIEMQILAGVQNIRMPQSTEIKNALREHFKLTPMWNSKFDRQWIEWAVSVEMTEKQILYASWTWQGDERYSWQAPNMKALYDHWEDLKVLQWSPPIGTWKLLRGGTGSNTWEEISNGEWARVSDGKCVGGE